jgi:hypothetical protein
MRVALVVGLLFCSSLAGAAPAKTATGTVLFEARWTSGKARLITKLFSTGMWTQQATSPGRPASTTSGRIASQRFDEIKAALAAAKWKRLKPQAQCLGVDTDTVDFYVAGK